MNQIRPIAICAFHHQDRILVFEGYEKAGNEIFYRLLGGGIEFGEQSEVAVRRELMEENRCQGWRSPLFGYAKKFYDFTNKPYHGIVIVYDGELIDSGCISGL